MNAQKIISELNKINPDRLGTKLKMLPENVSIVEDIFNLARSVEPTEKTGLDHIWEFWLWTDRGNYEDYIEAHKEAFTFTTIAKYFNGEEGEVDYERMKEQWPVLFPKDIVWFRLRLYDRQDDHNKLVSLGNRRIAYTGELGEYDMEPLLGWILEAVRDCVDMIKTGTYSEYVEQHLPFRCRSGLVKMSTYWKYVPEDKESIFGKIDAEELAEFQKWDENEDSGWNKMTSNDFFGFCNTLYDLLDLKSKYPVEKRDLLDGTLSPKDYYMAYSSNYDSSEPFKELDGDSSTAFDKLITEDYTEHHTWEVCLDPNIHLYPIKNDGRFFISIVFDHKAKDYDLLIHLALGLRKHGIPIKKPLYVLQEMSGEQLVAIVPDDGKYDWRYEIENGIETYEKRRLPTGVSEDIYREIEWFPIGVWFFQT